MYTQLAIPTGTNICPIGANPHYARTHAATAPSNATSPPMVATNVTQLTTLTPLPAAVQSASVCILAPTNLPEEIPSPTIQRIDLAYFFSEKDFVKCLKLNVNAINKKRAQPLYKILEEYGGIVKLSQHHIIPEGEIRREFAHWIAQSPPSEISRELRLFARSLAIIKNDFDRILGMQSFQLAPDQFELLYDRLIPWVSYFPGVLVAGPEEGTRVNTPEATFDQEVVNPLIREKIEKIWSKSVLNSPLQRLHLIQKLVKSHSGPRWEMFKGKWRVKDFEGAHPNVENLIQTREETRRFDVQTGEIVT